MHVEESGEQMGVRPLKPALLHNSDRHCKGSLFFSLDSLLAAPLLSFVSKAAHTTTSQSRSTTSTYNMMMTTTTSTEKGHLAKRNYFSPFKATMACEPKLDMKEDLPLKEKVDHHYPHLLTVLSPEDASIISNITSSTILTPNSSSRLDLDHLMEGSASDCKDRDMATKELDEEDETIIFLVENYENRCGEQFDRVDGDVDIAFDEKEHMFLLGRGDDCKSLPSFKFPQIDIEESLDKFFFSLYDALNIDDVVLSACRDDNSLEDTIFGREADELASFPVQEVHVAPTLATSYTSVGPTSVKSKRSHIDLLEQPETSGPTPFVSFEANSLVPKSFFGSGKEGSKGMGQNRGPHGADSKPQDAPLRKNLDGFQPSAIEFGDDRQTKLNMDAAVDNDRPSRNVWSRFQRVVTDKFGSSQRRSFDRQAFESSEKPVTASLVGYDNEVMLHRILPMEDDNEAQEEQNSGAKKEDCSKKNKMTNFKKRRGNSRQSGTKTNRSWFFTGISNGSRQPRKGVGKPAGNRSGFSLWARRTKKSKTSKSRSLGRKSDGPSHGPTSSTGNSNTSTAMLTLDDSSVHDGGMSYMTPAQSLMLDHTFYFQHETIVSVLS